MIADIAKGLLMLYSEKLIQLRKDNGWTQGVAAKNISIQQSYLSKLENGHHYPSEEIIQKLCDTYNVSRKELMLDAVRPSGIPKHWILILILGIALIISGYLGLIFPQTYFTYKVTAIELNNPSAKVIKYHVSDKYKGEKFSSTVSSNEYEYSLIADRDILRQENRWLIAIGLVLTLIAAGYLGIDGISRYNLR